MIRRHLIRLIPLAFLLIVTIVASALRIYVPVTLETVALQRSDACSGRFQPHELDHITTPTTLPIGFYDSNGAGLAIDDLDKDGLLDIVLANLAGDNAVFWNKGDLQFQKQALPSAAPSRAVATVDVDGDGWLDIVFTQQAAAPLYWLDADRDGDLDLVTGSYDVENEMILGQSAPKSGVIYYEKDSERFRATRIADRSNTLAIF